MTNNKKYEEMLKKARITSIDDLLCVPKGNSLDIPLDQLRAFSNHPFRVVDDDKMQELVDSIKENGVLTPVVVREITENRYEIISGHRRCHAAKKAGLLRVPCVVRNLTDDEATVLMVDANIQREEILPSERAFAFKMKMEAMRHQGSTLGHDVPKLSSDIIGNQSGVSGRQVKRYIRLTELIPELLELVDRKSLTMVLGVEISYISKEIQTVMYHLILEGKKIKSEHVELIRYEESKGTLTEERVKEIICGKQRKSRDNNLVLPMIILNNYFPEGTKNEDIESVIYQLLDEWKERGGTNDI